MEKEQRSKLQRATQDARKLLEEEFRSQLLQTYDIDVEKVRWAEEPGAHLQPEQRLIREKLVAWIEHKEAQINDRKEALLLALREMAFTALNRFVALKLMEARELVRPCVSGGLESAGFLEFTAVAQGLLADQESSYRLYLETIFEDVSRELRALFNPRDPASLLWPKRTALLELLEILNRPELAELWIEDETLGWVYQYFNGDAERKKMREESSAPRNSRELAVRNQFFTPRYVVEFLTDNTLGRIWYEMRQGNTGLKDRCRYLVRRPNEIWLQPGEEPPAQADADEGLSKEELLRQPVYISHRLLKDPREIRMLDPACGSMHFGLYAFDLYVEIYKEAWEIAQGSNEQSKEEEAFSPFIAYAADFADKSAFLREVPRLILRHNIHGIDIDPRATQIARLTLWLRAQRAWQEQQLQIADRPPINRSNVVCAEPMPGERELLADFVDEQFPEAERGLVQLLLASIFDKMLLAGEAGSLLKIEEEIRDAIDQARKEWQKLEVHQQDLFSAAELEALGQVGSSLNTDLHNLTKDFWAGVEERIYTALRHYAEQAEYSDGYQRQLFAEDAAQGFAFIDVYRKKYDSIVMNPPFGECSALTKELIEHAYPDSKSDIYACFFERALCLAGRNGLTGALTSRLGLFVSSLEKWREKCFLGGHRLSALLDLGHKVLDDALVEAAAYVSEYRDETKTKPQFWALGLLSKEDKASALKAALNNAADAAVGSLDLFSSIPGKPIAYWIPPGHLSKLLLNEALSSGGMGAWVGLQTDDDFRFLRLVWEVPSASIGNEWIFYAKGGEYSPFFDDTNLVVNWKREAEELKAFVQRKYSWTKRASGSELYGKPGLTYAERTTSELSLRPLPEGAIFSVKGPAIFAESRQDLLALISLSYTRIFRILLEVFIGGGDAVHSGSAARDYKTGIFNRFPLPSLRSELGNALAETGLGCIRESMHIKSLEETSSFFQGTQAISTKTFLEYCNSSLQELELRLKQLERLTHEADTTATCLYNCSDSDDELLSQLYGVHPYSLSREASQDEVLAQLQMPLDLLIDSVSRKFGFSRQSTKLSFWTDRRYEAIALLNNTSVERIISLRQESGLIPAWFSQREAKRMLSYCIGIVFGRWNALATSDHGGCFKEHDPFSPLPCCSPARLQNPLGLPAESHDTPQSYPVEIAWDGIVVDDPGHQHDIENVVVASLGFNCILNSEASLDAIALDLCRVLGLSNLREWFSKPGNFFANHLSQYSKSRRQAPVYWQLSAGNGNYSTWLYYHRFTQDTLYRVLRDFVEPRIQQAEREQFELESRGALSGKAATQLQEEQSLLQDLRILKSELDLVAPLWNPNLNDGVIINHAILWRITPYTPWQKKCKECWDKLVKGDYDWAHLAFHLWPERVIPKCITDRSLAIAHGLEERLWQEINNGNWLPRQLSEADLQALIAEHSNPAIKSALERFLAAPPPVAPTRTRASRSTRASGSSTPRRTRGSAAVVDAEATRQVLLALTAAPSDGLAKTQIADLIGVEANALTAVIKQLKESGQIDQLGERRGARYVLSEQGRAAVAAVAGGDA